MTMVALASGMVEVPLAVAEIVSNAAVVLAFLPAHISTKNKVILKNVKVSTQAFHLRLAS